MNELTSGPKKCPKCGAPLEEGLLSCPGGLGWLGHREVIELISSLFRWAPPKLKAWRCEECGLVMFFSGRDEGAKP